MNCQQDGEEVASALLLSKPDARGVRTPQRKTSVDTMFSKHLVHTSTTSEPSPGTSDSTHSSGSFCFVCVCVGGVSYIFAPPSPGFL